MIPDPLTIQLEQLTAETIKLKTIINRLGGMMLTAKRENTDEWMQHLVGMLNQACADIGDESRFMYDHRKGLILAIHEEHP